MSPKKEKLLQEAYDAYIDLMLRDFPIDRMEDIVAPDISGYGTTLDEKILNIGRLRKLVTDQREQGAGMEIRFNSTPIHRRIGEVEDSAIFVDEFEILISSNDGHDVIPLRLSSVFEFSGKEWKLVHIHGSKAVETEGDTWHREEWKKKNDQLLRLVDEKTADLERKNRELEIETGLERVRTIAMGMRKPDDLLDVCKAISEQLVLLQITDIRNVQVAIIDTSRKHYLNYQYFTPYSKKVFEVTEYENHPASQGMVTEMKKSANSFFAGHMKGKALNGFREWRKRYDQFPDPLLDGSPAVFYYFYSIGAGGLGLTTYREISEASLEVFQRFHKVFTLAYRRFIDIELAERQAHEARVETALERVRAVAMAMHKAEDLSVIGKTIFTELRSLGFSSIRNVEMVINNDEKETVTSYHYSDYGQEEVIEIGYKENPVVKKWAEDLRKAEDAFVPVSIPKKEIKAWDKYRLGIGYKPDPTMAKARELHYYSYSTGPGALSISTWLPLSADQVSLLERFKNVFKLSYQRFRDIEQAEAQAREAEVQLALERVRSRSMAMHHTSDLQDVINTVYLQFKSLDMPITGGAFIAVNEENKKEVNCWGAGGTAEYVERVYIPYYDRPIYTGLIECINTGPGLYEEEFSIKEKTGFFNFLFKHPPYTEAPPERIKEIRSRKGGYTRSVAVEKHTSIFIINHHGRRFSDEENNTLMRFGKVFEQTYTRFLDLKKAEEQAREARVEATLEKIRSQVTAMQESAELLDIVVTMRSEFVTLGHEAHYFWYMRYLPEIYEKAMTSGDGTRIGMVMSLPRHIHGDIKLLADWEKSNEPTVVFAMDVETAVDYVHKMITLGDFKQVDPNAPTLDDIHHIGGLTFVMARTTHGEIGYSLPGVVPNPPEEDLVTLVRFAGVFDLAYRRFEDLQTAERRNRETQVELALERVRARTMAMQHSDELKDAAMLLFQQLEELGVPVFGCGFNIWDEDQKAATAWMAGKDRLQPPFKTSSSADIFLRIHKAAQRGEQLFVEEQGGDALKTHYGYMKSIPDFKKIADNMAKAGQSFPAFQIMHCAFFSQGYLMFISFEPVESSHDIFKRFAVVFEQTYTRFLDLKRTEAQARESQIEAALERVRSRTMGMQKSEELAEVVAGLFDQLDDLRIRTYRCSLGIVNAGNDRCQLWSTTNTGKVIPIAPHVPLTENVHLKKIYTGWKKQGKPVIDRITGKKRLDWTNYINQHVNFKEYKPENIDRELILSEPAILQSFFFRQGFFTIHTREGLQEEAFGIIQRFANVFEQTYTRFLDLQKAEAQAREAVKQASLDRIRGHIASMRNTHDLQRITPIIWRELQTLEVPFFRCGIFIVEEKKNHVQVHLTTPDGEPLGALDLPLDANELTINTVASWRNKEVYQEHWTKEAFLAWTKEMMKLRQINTPEHYQGAAAPPESLHLHFIPFTQGMLYVGNNEQLDQEKITLVQSLAEAFSHAYARYEDFIILEEAKQRVEKALGDLKATQAQLIHAEKMASLGELTAGIAHEIQNPLNFVNNFSEVCVDILGELSEEMEKGNTEEVYAITGDLKQNLEKIHHHGKRASGIVKGMLEHSRSGSGAAEPTDINILADEYLRLAYHGLRAKDKSFHADFKTDLDEKIPKVNVIPQDMGRVLLNLINNAFYAVSDKAGKGEEGYKPTVTVSTRKMGKGIEIRVKDNGNGIPPKVQEKIFQPFFTTKPAGEGTGLGLSLSYDIITKGHGGDLQVETKEGLGTEFIIVLH